MVSFEQVREVHSWFVFFGQSLIGQDECKFFKEIVDDYVDASEQNGRPQLDADAHDYFREYISKACVGFVGWGLLDVSFIKPTRIYPSAGKIPLISEPCYRLSKAGTRLMAAPKWWQYLRIAALVGSRPLGRAFAKVRIPIAVAGAVLTIAKVIGEWGTIQALLAGIAMGLAAFFVSHRH